MTVQRMKLFHFHVNSSLFNLIIPIVQSDTELESRKIYASARAIKEHLCIAFLALLWQILVILTSSCTVAGKTVKRLSSRSILRGGMFP